MPRSIHISDMNPWKDAQGGMVLWKPASYSTLRNPYWTMNEDFNKDNTDRLLTMIKLEYKFTNWLKLHLRHGMDKRFAFMNLQCLWIRNPSDGSTEFQFRFIVLTQPSHQKPNSDFLFTATKTVN